MHFFFTQSVSYYTGTTVERISQTNYDRVIWCNMYYGFNERVLSFNNAMCVLASISPIL